MQIAVLASGRGSNLESLFRSLKGHPSARIALVLSDRLEAKALDRARDLGIAAAVIPHDDPEAILSHLRAHEIDWIVLAGYLRRVPRAVVAEYPDRILNIHPALLPKFGGKGMYGERVHRAVLEAGEAESGASVHLVDEEYDRGPIVAQRRVSVEAGDTPQTLAARVLEVEHALLPEVVRAAAEGRIRVAEGRAWIESGIGAARGNAGE